MARKTSSRLEDLNLTKEEVDRLGDALKKEEFRKLLFEYAREINDPENKKQYEEEITQLENERGVDVKFVHPEPQYVLKTCFNPGGEKVFVNICSNSLVGKPSSKPKIDAEGSRGTNWSIPLLQAPPREDLDKSGVLCTVYDVIFHPDTHDLAAKDRRFRNFVEETALNAVEETFSVKLDRNSVKRPRMKFKGLVHPTVIRTRRPKAEVDKEDDDNFISQFAYPYDLPPEEKSPVRKLKPTYMEPEKENELKENYIIPKYTIKQSSDVDMADFEQNLLSHHGVTVPQRLVLLVDLPYIKSSSELELDLEANSVSLASKGKRRYKLELKLPYPVKESEGTAKFDQDASKLLVTMLVDREKAVLKKPHTPEGDSGIESDLGYGKTSSGEDEESKVALQDRIRKSFSHSRPAEVENVSEGASGDITEMGFNKDISAGQCLIRRNSSESSESNTSGGEIDRNEIEPKVEQNEQTSNEVEKEKLINQIKKISISSQDAPGSRLPYQLPTFMGSCHREKGSTLVTFILNVKNVDPSSIEKRVNIVRGFCENVQETKEKICSFLASSDTCDTLSENGSVCNEYRTVEKKVSSFCASMTSDDDDAKKSEYSDGNGEVSHRTNSNVTFIEPLNNVDRKVSDQSFNDILNISSPESSQQLGNGAGDKVESFGANLLSVVDFEEDTCDALNKSLMMEEDNSLEKKMGNQEMICFQVTFSSVGAGYFPLNYSFCICFPLSSWPNVDIESSDFSPLSIEIWDNNVELQLRKPSDKIEGLGELRCFVGLDSNNLEPSKLSLLEDKEIESVTELEVSSSSNTLEDKKEIVPEIQSDTCDATKERSSDENDHLSSAERRKIFKERTLSESSVESNPAKQATKGILKRRGRASLGRSLSESSCGEEYTWVASGSQASLSSSVALSPSLSEVNRITLGNCLKEEEEEYEEEEDDEEEDGEKVKKIVRFSDVISQKTYRSNSSILGQRKKNQRKTRNKKRAAERRASESENSVDEGENITEKPNSDCISDTSPPQKADIPLPADPSNLKGKTKGASKKKGVANKGKGKKVDTLQKAEGASDTSVSQQYEFKSDLIFQLEL